MAITAWESYSPTLLHWLLLGGGLMISILLLYRVLLFFGVNREAATGYALILPWLLGFLILNLYPFARSLYLSFTEYNIFQPPEWVGLDNYVELFTRDRHFYPKKYLMNKLCVALAGRAAEKIVFDDVSTGAENDLKDASSLAEKMVAQWGMSDEVGPLSLGRGEEHPFLGRELAHSRETADAIRSEDPFLTHRVSARRPFPG